mgnify:CR=1 FL=1
MNQKQKELAEAVIEEIIKPVLPQEHAERRRSYLVNPTGRFEIGGPHGDARPHRPQDHRRHLRRRGAARRRRVLGQDPSKVDRSAAYAARYVAKNIVAAGHRRQVPGAGLLRDRRRAADQRHRVPPRAPARSPTTRSPQLVHAHFDLRPKGIIQMLDLLRPIYLKTAAYGHFGRDEPEFTWEAIDRVEALRAAASAASLERALRC